MSIYKNLEAELARGNITRADMAKVLNLNLATMSKKMTRPGLMRLDEARMIRDSFFKSQSLDYLFATETKTT